MWPVATDDRQVPIPACNWTCGLQGLQPNLFNTLTSRKYKLLGNILIPRACVFYQHRKRLIFHPNYTIYFNRGNFAEKQLKDTCSLKKKQIVIARKINPPIFQLRPCLYSYLSLQSFFLLTTLTLCYRFGPPSDIRSLNLIQWFMQFCALLGIYISLQVHRNQK